MADERTSVTERHIQTFIGAIMIGLTIWIGSSVTGSREAIAELRVESNMLREQVNEMRLDLKEVFNDKITRSEVERVQEMLNERIKALEARMILLETKLQSGMGFNKTVIRSSLLTSNRGYLPHLLKTLNGVTL